MANMRLKMGEYEVWIVVERQEVEHYAIEINEESRVATCWIESSVGKHFGIRARKHHENFDCACEVLLDGSVAAARYLSRVSNVTASIDDCIIGESSVRPFLFGVLQLTDEETSIVTSHENLGEIIVRFWRVKDIRPLRFAQPSDITVKKIDKVHEQAKKAVTHQAMFGQTVEVSKRVIRPVERGEQVAKFIFRYRSFDMLKANGLVPRDCPRTTLADSSQATGSAGSVLGKRKVQVKEEEEEEGSEDELEDEKDKSKVAELEAELERVKKACLARQQQRAKKRVKPEPKPTFLRGEVIDLTID